MRVGRSTRGTVAVLGMALSIATGVSSSALGRGGLDPYEDGASRQVPTGPPFPTEPPSGAALPMQPRVNESQTGSQERASLALRADDTYLVTWQSEVGGRYGLEARLFGVDGQPLGPDVQVIAASLGAEERDHFHPSTCAQADGTFVAVWEGRRLGGGDPGIFARQLGTDGRPTGAAVRVASLSGEEPEQNVGVYPQVACSGNGGFLAVWHTPRDADPADHPAEIFLRRFASVAAPIDTAPVRLTDTLAREYGAAVAIGPGGEIVIVFGREDGILADVDLYALVLPWTWDPAAEDPPATWVVEDSPTRDRFQGLFIDPDDGTLYLAWSSLDRGYSSVAKAYAYTGAGAGERTQLLYIQLDPALTNDAVSPTIYARDGRYLVSFKRAQELWQNGGRNIFAATGDDLGGIYPVNDYVFDQQQHPVGAIQSDGTYVLVWTSVGQEDDAPPDANLYQARWSGRYPAACIDSDGDGFGEAGNLVCPGGIDPDCNDSDPSVNPGAVEIPDDGIDNDCDPTTPQGGCNAQPRTANATMGERAGGVQLPVDLGLFMIPALLLVIQLRGRRGRLKAE